MMILLQTVMLSPGPHLEKIRRKRLSLDVTRQFLTPKLGITVFWNQNTVLLF